MFLSRKRIPIGLRQLISPKGFYEKTHRWPSILCVLSLMSVSIGVVGALWVVPPDYQQGDAFRILYIHVPAAFLSLTIYTIIAFNSMIYMVFKVKMADVWAEQSASIGLLFSFLSLLTGSLWGKPMWGAYWVWDARLSSALLLFFLYLGYILLRQAIRPPSLSAKVGGILAIMGLVDIPIIHFSVEWWHTLHQGASFSRLAKPAMPFSLLWPLVFTLIGFGVFYLSVLFLRVRARLLEKEYDRAWVKRSKGKAVACSTQNTSSLAMVSRQP